MITLYHYYNGAFLFQGSELKCLEYMGKGSYKIVNKYNEDWYVENY